MRGKGWGWGGIRSGVTAFLLTFLLLFPLFLAADPTTPRNPNPQEKPKPILDAPSLRIPAAPAYQTTLKELGYKDTDDLLKQTLQAGSPVTSVAFDKTGQWLASGLDDGTVKLWDVESGQLKQTLQAGGSVNSVVFDGGGQLASGSNDGTVKMWDVKSGTLKQTLQAGSPVTSVAFDGGGQLASGSIDGTVKLWDVKSGALKQTLQAQSDVLSVAFDGGGQLASGSSDGMVKLWDVKSGVLKQTLPLIAGSHVNSVSFDGGGQLSGSSDSTVKLWDVKSGALKQTLQAGRLVLSVAFDGSGQLASSSEDGTVKLWDVKNGVLKQTLQAGGSGYNPVCVAFDGGGQLAFGSEDGTVKLWDVKNGILKQTLQAQSSVLSVVFDGDGQLASGSKDGTVKLWDVKSGALKQTLQSHQPSILGGISVTFDGVGQLASGSIDGTVKLWDVKSGTLKQTLQASGWIFGTTVAFDGKGQLASGSEDGMVKLWDVKSGTLKQTLQAQGRVSSVAFDKTGQWLAADSNDGTGTVKLWDVKSGTLKQTLQAGSPVTSVAFDGGGQLASGSIDGTVKLWDVKSGVLKQTLQAQSPVNSVVFGGGGQVASGSDDGTVKLWDVQSGILKHILQAQSPVNSVAFDGRGQLASGSDDGTVKLWDSHSGRLMDVLLAGARGVWASVLADGKVLRADEGSLLRTGTLLAEGKYPFQEKEMDKEGDYSSHRWQDLPAPTSSTVAMTLALEQPNVAFPNTIAPEVLVKLTNSSDQPIHRPCILPTHSEDGSIQVIPAEPQPTYPQTEAIYSSTSLIPPGATIRLAARLLATTPQPAKSGDYQIPITVEVSGGETKTVMLAATLQTPDVKVIGSSYSATNNTLNIRLRNEGSAALPKTDFYLSDYNDKTLSLPSQTLETISPQTETALAFNLPNWKQRDKLQLEIRPMHPPLYSQWVIPLTVKAGLPMYLQAALTMIALMLLSLTVFYFRRYRHPLVLELGAQPQALHRLPLEQLTEARQRLQQTGRLNTTLDSAEVSQDTFQHALDFQQTSAEQKAQWLAMRLGGQVTAVEETLYALKLPETFPLNADRILLFFPTADAQDVFTHLQAIPQAEGRITLIIGADSAYQRKLLNTTQDLSNKYVAPQSKQITELLLSPRADSALANILSEQLSLKQISPYQIGGGVNKEALFFGRRELIAQIVNRAPANYLLVGGRQMGKSTLLKALERRYATNPQVQCLYHTLSNEVMVPRLARALQLADTDNAETFAAALEQRIRDTGQRFIFLIDEADRFIEHEQAQGYPILNVFRRLSEQGNCSFILAGFWQLYQHAVLDYQSPLRNFGEVLEIGALERDACQQLATQPMQTMNLGYASDAIVQDMIEKCGQRANLIAWVCHQLIQNLPAQQRSIEAGDIHRVLDSRDMSKRLEGWVVGISEQEQRYDRLVVYATIGKGSFSTGELIQQLEAQHLTFDAAELERTLSRLELAFILTRASNRWQYCVPLFTDYLLADEPEVKLATVLKQW